MNNAVAVRLRRCFFCDRYVGAMTPTGLVTPDVNDRDDRGLRDHHEHSDAESDATPAARELLLAIDRFRRTPREQRHAGVNHKTSTPKGRQPPPEL